LGMGLYFLAGFWLAVYYSEAPLSYAPKYSSS